MTSMRRSVRLGVFFLTACSLLLTPAQSRSTWVLATGGTGDPTLLVTITGTVKDNAGTPFTGAEVQAIDPISDTVVTSTLTNSSGAYTLSVVQGTYDVKAIPPAGSGFTPTILIGQTVLSPTIIDFVLVPAGTCIFSGRITDRDGNPVGNHPVQLTSFTSLYDTTDALGHFSLTASPGFYTFSISSSSGSTNPHIPAQFMLIANDLSLSTSTVLDIQLPNVALTVDVLDPANVPVRGAIISTDLAMTVTTFSVGPVVFHGYIGGTIPTDTSGRAVFWMFPTRADLRISPPEESGCAPMRLDGVSVRADTAITVHLVSTVTLSGRITDRDGGPVAHQPVQLTSFTTLYDTTDALGNYSLTASPGTYALDIHSLQGSTNQRIPAQFQLIAHDFALQVDSVLDIQLPNVGLTIDVRDPANTPVAGATIGTDLAMTVTTFSAGPVVFHGYIGGTVSTDTNGRAVFWMFPTTADLRISPPEGSGFAPMRLDGVPVRADTAITVHLISTVTLSGRITDRDGGSVGAQPIQLVSFTTLYDTTDSFGHYSLTASPGTYALDIQSLHGSANPRIPRQFMLRANDVVLAADSILDIRLPNVSLTITVLDQVNAPVPGATVSADMAMTSTTFSAGPAVFHGSIGGSVVTDSTGQAVFWMFPTTADLLISPPEGSGFLPFRVDSVALTSDRTMVVHLETATGVHSGDGPPTQLLLLRNYPNPFNPTTTVEFQLTTAGRVRVSVVDLLGREAAVLVDEERPAGIHRATWDATRCASGVYVCRLLTAGQVQMRKLILLR